MTRNSRMPANDVKLYAKLHRVVQYPIVEIQRYRSQDEACLTDRSHADKGQVIQAVCAQYNRPMVLDLGCGTGRYFHYAHRAAPGKLIALDYCRSMLDEAKSAVNAGRADLLIHGSLFELGFREETFDVVYCVGLFGVWCRLDGALLAAIARLRKPEGTLFLTNVAAEPPGTEGWKGRLARVVEPYLAGELKRWVHVRRRNFALDEPSLRSLAESMFGSVSIHRWRSE